MGRAGTEWPLTLNTTKLTQAACIVISMMGAANGCTGSPWNDPQTP
jgi:hypothetical protein